MQKMNSYSTQSHRHSRGVCVLWTPLVRSWVALEFQGVSEWLKLKKPSCCASWSQRNVEDHSDEEDDSEESEV